MLASADIREAAAPEFVIEPEVPGVGNLSDT